MKTLDTLKERYTEVKDRIERAAASSGRRGSSVMLVAVSKYSGVDQIRELMALGQQDFGESQVQQLLQRAAMIDEWQRRQGVLKTTGRDGGDGGGGAGGAGGGVRWHMIGHLQRNKVRKAVDVVRLVHSVDSLRLAEEIQTIAVRSEKTVDVLVQVNASGEASKFGCAPAACLHLAEQIDTMVNVRVRGLMTMAAPGVSQDETRATFARCRELYEEVAKAGIGGAHLNMLSMGMSGDYEAAIAEGSNLVRVGSAIFGPPAAGMVEGDEEGE